MHRSLRHRTLCALAALSLAFSAAPAAVSATFAVGPLPACSHADVSPTSGVDVPESPPSVSAVGADRGEGAPACGPGPCSMPFTTCAGAGACLSVLPLPAGASPALSAGFIGVDAFGTEGGPPSPAFAILTPPPRG